jgi:hypothetical protein
MSTGRPGREVSVSRELYGAKQAGWKCQLLKGAGWVKAAKRVGDPPFLAGS